MMRTHPTHRTRSNMQGFGLVELLVSIALFLTIIGSVAVIFNGSLRALRQAEQNQEIFEMVRGAQQVMERDLGGAFASREYGDFYQFYGTPIGFTFVGLINSPNDETPNLARVTYVLRRDTNRTIIRQSTSEFVDDAGLLVDRDVSDDALDNDLDGFTDEPDEGLEVQTFSLIRYVERGKSDLESFPIDWEAEPFDDLDPINPPNNLAELIGDPQNPDFTYNNYVQQAVANGVCRATDTDCLVEVQKAARRELWIRILGLADGTGDAPDLADYFPNIPTEAEDYVLLENIVLDDEGAAFETVFGDILGLGLDPTSASLIVEDLDSNVTTNQVQHNGQMFQYRQWAGGFVDANAPTVTFASNANPVTLTVPAHGIPAGELVRVEDLVGMIDPATTPVTTLNGGTYTVANVTANTFDLAGVDGTGLTPYNSGGTVIWRRQITAATQDLPVEITSNGHGLTDGDTIRIEGVDGMTRLNGRVYTVINSAANTFELRDENGLVDTRDYAVYVANGEIVEQASIVRPNAIGFWGDWRNTNLANNGIDDDGDGTIDSFDPDELPLSLLNDGIDNDNDGGTDLLDPELDEWLFAEGFGAGSPLDPEIPSQVGVRFRIFYTSAVSGAGDFERNFEFNVDVPSGYRRLGLDQ